MEITYTDEQKRDLFAKLAEPFPPDQLKWRLQAKTRDEKKGRFVAFADIRSYTDRLNSLFSPSGWSKTIQIQSFSAHHQKHGASTRLVFILKLNIFGLAIHESSIEGWAHEENIATRCEAQAFKRACSETSLGRYIYNIRMTDWVEINAYGDPLKPLPAPRWTEAPAAAPSSRTTTPPKAAVSGTVVSPTVQKTRGQSPVVTMPSTTVPPEVEAFRNELGPGLYNNALHILRTKVRSNWSHDESCRFAVTELNKIKQGITEVRRFAESNRGIWEYVLDMYQVENMQSFQSVEQFREFYVAFQNELQKHSKAA